MAKKVSFGGILNETSSLVAQNLREVGLFILILGAYSAMGVMAGFTESVAGSFNYGVSYTPGEPVMSMLFEIGNVALSLVATYLLIRHFVTARRIAGDGSNRFWQFCGLYFLSIIGIALGFLLLVIPGLFLLVRWTAAPGFVVTGKHSITESFSASWAATRGHGWVIFFSGLVLVFGLLAIFGVGSLIFWALNPWVGGIISAFFEVAISAISLGYAAAVYLMVSDDSAELQDVFG